MRRSLGQVSLLHTYTSVSGSRASVECCSQKTCSMEELPGKHTNLSFLKKKKTI